MLYFVIYYIVQISYMKFWVYYSLTLFLFALRILVHSWSLHYDTNKWMAKGLRDRSALIWQSLIVYDDFDEADTFYVWVNTLSFPSLSLFLIFFSHVLHSHIHIWYSPFSLPLSFQWILIISESQENVSESEIKGSWVNEQGELCFILVEPVIVVLQCIAFALYIDWKMLVDYGDFQPLTLCKRNWKSLLHN